MALRITEQRSLHTTGTELNTCGTLVFSILAVIGEQPPESGMGEVCFEICTGLGRKRGQALWRCPQRRIWKYSVFVVLMLYLEIY